MSVGTEKDKSGQSGAVTKSTHSRRGKRVSREERGLPPLTKAQRIARQIVQGAQNACAYIKSDIDDGNMPSGEVLQACSILSGQLGQYLGRS